MCIAVKELKKHHCVEKFLVRLHPSQFKMCFLWKHEKTLNVNDPYRFFHFEHYNIFVKHTQRPGRKATIIRSEQHTDFANVHIQHKGHVNKIRISLCFYFCALTNCLCRVALLPSVCTMASDVSKSGASAQCHTSAFACLQDFFVKFTPAIVQLKKQNLREVVMSHQAKKHAEWKRAQNGFVRQSASLTLGEKELLEDWQFILCDMSTLESVALLSGLQRCYQRVDSFLNEHVEALKKLLPRI